MVRLHLRRRACQLEVSLNQRLAPDVYLGVEDVVVADGALEPAVVMRRMPAHRRLAHLVTSGHDVRAELRSVHRGEQHGDGEDTRQQPRRHDRTEREQRASSRAARCASSAVEPRPVATVT